MAENVQRKQARQPGGTPARLETVRQRVGSSSSSSSSEDDGTDSDDDSKDRAWHKKKNKKRVRPAVWTHNATAHYARVHSTSSMPPAFAKACETSAEGISRLKKLLK